jgi:flavin reductase (DIM6/NTAB) family NADH-FMN oxidoreductase RutF
MSEVITAANGGSSSVDVSAFRNAMRQLAGGISVITVGNSDHRSGLTVTSVSSLSAEPPIIIFCISRASSSWSILKQSRTFAVNVLGPDHLGIAERFSGRNGEKGHERYAGAAWIGLVTGTPILADAAAALDCTVEELIERHSSAIVLGRVQSVKIHPEPNVTSPLMYWRGNYTTTRT